MNGNVPGGGVQVVERALDILEQLSQAAGPIGPTKIAMATGLTKSTVYRLLATLCNRKYVEKNEEDGTYFLGPKLLEVASLHISSLELQTEARPFLTQMAANLNLTTHLGVLDAHEVIYVEKLDQVPSLRLYSQIGQRVPAYCSSLGKCLLACLSGAQLEEALRGCRFQKYTDATITNLRSLKQQLREVRNQGWAIDDQEYTLDHRCIGAPVYDYRGDVIAAISASGSLANLPLERVPTVVREVKETAGQISRRLGYIE